MALRASNSGARFGLTVVEVVNDAGYWLVVRVPDDETVGFELGFDSPDDLDAVKRAAKDIAPELAAEIDAVTLP
jgi:hypothetical protein